MSTFNSYRSCLQQSKPNTNQDFQCVVTLDDTSAKGLGDGVYPDDHPDPAKVGQPFVWPGQVVGAVVTLDSIDAAQNNYVRYDTTGTPTASVGDILVTGEELHIGFTDKQDNIQDLLSESMRTVALITTEVGIQAVLTVRFVINSCTNPPTAPIVAITAWPTVALTNSPPVTIGGPGTIDLEITAADVDLVDAASFASGIEAIAPDGTTRIPLVLQSVIPNTGNAASLAGIFRFDATGFTAADDGVYTVVAKTSLQDALGNALPSEQTLFVFTYEQALLTLIPTTLATAPNYTSQPTFASGKIWFTPSSADDVMYYDVGANSVGFISTGNTGVNKWDGKLTLVGGALYGTPRSSNAAAGMAILKIDPDNLTVSKIVTGVSQNANRWRSDPIVVGTDIYFAPSNEDNLLKIETANNDAVTLINTGRTGTSKWKGGVYVPAANAIYFSPLNINEILKYNIGSGTFEYFTIATSSASGFYLSEPTLAANGKLYFCPWNNSTIAILDTATDTLTQVASGEAISSGWYGPFAILPDGRLIATPRDSGNNLIIDPTNDTVTLEATGGSGTSKWHNGALLASNNKLYATPRNEDRILIRDNAGAITLAASGQTGTNKWIGKPLEHDGWVYFTPMENQNILAYPIAL